MPSRTESAQFWEWKTHSRRLVVRTGQKENMREGFQPMFLGRASLRQIFLAVAKPRVGSVLFRGASPWALLPGSQGGHLSFQCRLFGLPAQTLYPPPPALALGLSGTDPSVVHCRRLSLLLWTHTGHCWGLQAFSWILQIASAWRDLFNLLHLSEQIL